MKPVCVIFLLLWSMCSSGRFDDAAKQKPSPSPTKDPCKLSEPECTYLRGAGNYLISVIRADEKAAVVMAAGSDLNAIKDEIEAAKIVNEQFIGDVSKLTVPPEFARFNRKLTEVHRLHTVAYNEYLAFWRDSNRGHIESGTIKFKKALVLTKQTLKDMNALLDGKAAELEKK